jgi:hypothetical protein
LYFAEPTPAVLRLESGANVPGRLKVVSVTGGLLSVAHPLERGSSAKLMFLTETGMVHGVAEMLSPLSWSVQPFRFVGLDRDDQNKLQTTIQRSIEQHRIERTQIESYRAW